MLNQLRSKHMTTQLIKLNLFTPFKFPEHVNKDDKRLLRNPSVHETEYYESLLEKYRNGDKGAFHKYQEYMRHIAIQRLPYVSFSELYNNMSTVELATRIMAGRKFNGRWLNEQITVAQADRLYVEYRKATINDGRAYIRIGEHARTSLGRFLSHACTTVECECELDLGNGKTDVVKFNSVLNLKNFIESSCINKDLLHYEPQVCRHQFGLLQETQPSLCGTQENTDEFVEYAYWARLKAVPEMMELFVNTSVPFVVSYLNFLQNKDELNIYVHIEQDNRHVNVLTKLREKLKANPDLVLPVPKLTEMQQLKYNILKP